MVIEFVFQEKQGKAKSHRTLGGKDSKIHTAAAPLAWVTRVLYRSCAALSMCFAAFSLFSSYCWRLVMAMYDFRPAYKDKSASNGVRKVVGGKAIMSSGMLFELEDAPSPEFFQR